jgi:hypothetical protein
MWITFSLFLQYSYISASVQCENCSHNNKSFPAIPNMPGSIGPKWFELWPPYNLGLVDTIISNAWIIIHFTIHSNSYKSWLQTTSFSVFIESFSSLITKCNWHHNHHNHSRRWRKCLPSAPHEALRFMPMLWMNRLQPPKIADVIWGGGWGCVWPSKCSFVLAMMNCHNITSECLRAIHTLNSPQNYICLLRGLSPIHTLRWRGAQGLMWGTRGH